ncbi:hypothetical protein C8R43DRAFT_1131726 [Mycena crocata]|nr:hypothetical protein C8R43DRAFT_1131726 [Mycena crocata]
MNGGPARLNALGLGTDGSYAEYSIVTADKLIPVPTGVSPEVAVIASDAGITVYHAVQHTAKVRQGDKVLISGTGGVGHLVLQYAKHFGATVYACNFKPVACKIALELGAKETFDLIKLTNKTATGFIDCVALASQLIKVGISFKNIVFNTIDLISSGVSIHSSAYGPRSALVAALDLFAKGTARVHVQCESLENVNKVIEQLRASEVIITGRTVVIPHQSADDV